MWLFVHVLCEAELVWMFNNFYSNCDGLIKCVNVNDFITSNNYVAEDNFPFIIYEMDNRGILSLFLSVTP